MKKYICYLLTLILLLSCISIPVGATTKPTNADYQDAFKSFLESDGATAEHCASVVGTLYDADPNSFFKALSHKSTEEIVAITSALIYHNADRLELLSTDIRTLSENQFCTESVLNACSIALEEVNTTIDDYSYLNDTSIDITPARRNAFNKEIIRGFIDRNTSKYDLEFFDLMGQSYQKDPTLFAATVSDLDTEQISYLAQGISYSLSNSPTLLTTELETAPAPLELTSSERRTLSVIEREILSTTEAQILDFTPYTQIKTSALKPIFTSCVPVVENLTYIDDELSVEKENTLSFTLSLDTDSAATMYTIEIYTEQNDTLYLKDRFDVSIPAGKTSINIERPLYFYNPGDVTTTVNVYAANSTALLTTETTTSVQSVFASWQINIILGSHSYGYRDYPIWSLSTFSSNGQGGLFIDEILGRSVSGASPLIERGNTPTGSYSGYIGPVQSSSYSYGPHKVIMMNGVSGDIVSSGRSGIWIHGGDPSTNTSATTYPLRPTYGCVRLSNANQLTLINQISAYVAAGMSSTGGILIEESVE